MTAPIKVTVEGQPFEAAVTWGQVRAYLRARGWVHAESGEGGERWDRHEAWVWLKRHEPERFAELKAAWEQWDAGMLHDPAAPSAGNTPSNLADHFNSPPPPPPVARPTD